MTNLLNSLIRGTCASAGVSHDTLSDRRVARTEIAQVQFFVSPVRVLRARRRKTVTHECLEVSSTLVFLGAKRFVYLGLLQNPRTKL